MVGMMVRHGPFDFDRTRLRRCTRAPEHLSASAPPLIAAAEQPGQAGTPPLSTVGIVFASAVHRVRVTFAGGRKMTIALRPLTPSEARAASLALPPLCGLRGSRALVPGAPGQPERGRQDALGQRPERLRLPLVRLLAPLSRASRQAGPARPRLRVSAHRGAGQDVGYLQLGGLR